MFDPTKPIHTVEETQEVEDRSYTVRLSVQDGCVVSGSFTLANGQEGKSSDPSKLDFAVIARRAFKSAPKVTTDEEE